MKTLPEFAAAIAVVRVDHLDEIAREVWRGLARGSFSEAEAEQLSGAIEGRRADHKARVAQGGSRVSLGPSKGPCRSPDRQRSLERRRGLAASGVVPWRIASAFTTAEIAVLAVIGRACKARGSCELPIDAIAAMAGCSRTSVQNALRAAKALGLISVTERRHKGRPSEFNVIKIISLEWQGWLKLGGSAQGGRVQKTEHHEYESTLIPKNNRQNLDCRSIIHRERWSK
jgi:hypothetical protein